MRIAFSESGSTPSAVRRSKVSLRLKPASTSRRVLEVAIRVELPALDEAKTVTETMAKRLLERKREYSGEYPTFVLYLFA